jgi:hypothetical protein
VFCRVSGRAYGSLQPNLRAQEGLKSAAVAGVIGFGFQALDDWGNPYLTGGQKFGRALLSAGTAFTATYIGAAIGSAIPIPIVGTATGAVLGFGLGVAFELCANPLLFEWFGLVPKRHLVPLP